MEMNSSSWRLGVLLFLLISLLLASREGAVPMAEARVCESPSHGFHRTCVSDHNCAIICRGEGFSGGRCEGFRRRCFCTKLC